MLFWMGAPHYRQPPSEAEMSCRSDSYGKLNYPGTAGRGQRCCALAVWMLLLPVGPACAQDAEVVSFSVSPASLGTGALITVAVELSGFLPRTVPLNLQAAIDVGGSPIALESEPLEIREGARRVTTQLRINNPGTFTFTMAEPPGQNLLTGEERFRETVTVRGDPDELLQITAIPFPNPASRADDLVLYLLLYELNGSNGSSRLISLPEDLSFSLNVRGCQRTIAEGGCQGSYDTFIPEQEVTIPALSVSAMVRIGADVFSTSQSMTWEISASNNISTDTDGACITLGSRDCLILISTLPGDLLETSYYDGRPVMFAEAWEVDSSLPPPPPTRREKILLLVGNTSPRIVPLSTTVTLSVFLADAEPTLLEQRLLPMLPVTLSLSLFASVCPPGRNFCSDDAVRASTFTLTIPAGEDSGQVEIPAAVLAEPGTWEFTIGPLIATSTLSNPLLFSGTEPVSIVLSAPPQQINPEIYDYYGAGYIAALTTVLQVARLPRLRIQAPGTPVTYREPIPLEVSVEFPLAESIAVSVTAQRADGLEMISEISLGPGQSSAQLSFAPRRLPPGPWRFTATAAPQGIVDERGAEASLSVLSALRLEPATTVLSPGAELGITAALDGVLFSPVTITVTASLEGQRDHKNAECRSLAGGAPGGADLCFRDSDRRRQVALYSQGDSVGPGGCICRLSGSGHRTF